MGSDFLYVISISKEPVPEEPFDAEKELADAMTRIASASQSKSTLNLYYRICIYRIGMYIIYIYNIFYMQIIMHV